jgi:hypothetical protein
MAMGIPRSFFFGIMDEEETRLWKRIVTKGSIIVDGGANYGYWS